MRAVPSRAFDAGYGRRTLFENRRRAGFVRCVLPWPLGPVRGGAKQKPNTLASQDYASWAEAKSADRSPPLLRSAKRINRKLRPGLGASVRDEVRDVDGSDVVAAAGAGPSTT